MKTNTLKKCAFLLLMGTLVMPTQQIQAKTAGVADLAYMFIMAAAMAQDKQVKELNEEEAREIIESFFSEEKRATITANELARALRKFNMPVMILLFSKRSSRMYRMIQENLTCLPEEFQERFRLMSENTFCYYMQQLKAEEPANAQTSAQAQEVSAEPISA